MDLAIAQKIVNFIYEETGLFTIVCDDTAKIIAAKVATRVGTVHTGAQRLLSEKLPHITISKEEEEASGGVVRMGADCANQSGVMVAQATGAMLVADGLVA